MSDLPPQRRRWWSSWSVKGFAETEWRELTMFASELRRVERHIRTIIEGLGDATAHTPIALSASKFGRLARRWERRAAKAREDAIADHGGDRDWEIAYQQTINEDLAESLLAHAMNVLIDAERFLDDETRARTQGCRKALEEVWADVDSRDPSRSLGRGGAE